MGKNLTRFKSEANTGTQTTAFDIVRIHKRFVLEKLECFIAGIQCSEYEEILEEVSRAKHPENLLLCCAYCSMNTISIEDQSKYAVITTILLLNDSIDVDIRNILGETALFYLVRTGFDLALIKLANLMLSKGIDVNSTDYKGRTALHLTNSSSKYNTTSSLWGAPWDDFLISKGASVNVRETMTNSCPVEKVTTFTSDDTCFGVFLSHLNAGLNLTYLSPAALEIILSRAITTKQKYVLIAFAEAGGCLRTSTDMWLNAWESYPEMVDTFNSWFLTLQRLAANVIRVSLRPNAVVGVWKLTLPKQLKKFILDPF